MWILQLNMMRNKSEHLDVVAVAESKENLQAFVANESVDPYKDEAPGGWGNEDRMVSFNKNFRKGGPLEWYNVPYNHERNFIDVGTREDTMERAGEQYDSFLANIPNKV